MTYVDTGELGAKRQSWHRANPRETLKRVIDENPEASESELLELHWHFLARDIDFNDTEKEELFRTIHEYWFSNNYRSIKKGRKSPTKEAKEENNKQILENVTVLRKELTQKIDEKVHIKFLEILTPNGKVLRDCTKEDCADASGWFTRIAARLRPKQIVGDVLTENQLRLIYGEKR